MAHIEWATIFYQADCLSFNTAAMLLLILFSCKCVYIHHEYKGAPLIQVVASPHIGHHGESLFQCSIDVLDSEVRSAVLDKSGFPLTG